MLDGGTLWRKAHRRAWRSSGFQVDCCWGFGMPRARPVEPHAHRYTHGGLEPGGRALDAELNRRPAATKSVRVLVRVSGPRSRRLISVAATRGLIERPTRARGIIGTDCVAASVRLHGASPWHRLNAKTPRNKRLKAGRSPCPGRKRDWSATNERHTLVGRALDVVFIRRVSRPKLPVLGHMASAGSRRSSGF